jgi:hypothetical protein
MLYRQSNASIGENFSDEPWDALLKIPDALATRHETAQDGERTTANVGSISSESSRFCVGF